MKNTIHNHYQEIKKQFEELNKEMLWVADEEVNAVLSFLQYALVSQLEEIEKIIEELIDQNDDGMWTGRETAEHIILTIKQEKEKIINDK